MAPSTGFRQYIRDAIAAAKHAAGFYEVLAESTRDQAAHAFLDAQMIREKAHAEAFEIFALESTDRALPRYPNREVERSHTIPDWRAVNDISLEQAIQIVVEASNHSALLYGALSDGAEGKARTLLHTLAEQQEVRGDLLARLARAGWVRKIFAPSHVSNGALPRRLRNTIAADKHSSRTHVYMTTRTSDRATRIFLEQLALDEQHAAESLEVAVLEHLDTPLPENADDDASMIRAVPVAEPPHPVGIAQALEHAMLAWPLRIRDCREMAARSTGRFAEALTDIALERQEQLAQVVWRRTAYSDTQAEGIATAPPDRLLDPADLS